MLNALALLTSFGVLATIAVPAPTDLVAAAAASGRPAECMPVRAKGPAKRAGVWSRARTPNLQRYCALIARAHARIDESPTAAGMAARRADKLVPGHAAPHVVLARVALAKGDVVGAYAAFAEALKRDPRGVEQPVAMHDLARTQWRSGKKEEALDTYRVLVPRASLLPTRELRARVLLEAAHAAMTVAPARPAEQTRILDESLAYLREAARDTNHTLTLDVGLSLVLVLDRAGHRLQADAVLHEQRGTSAWASNEHADYLGSADDMHVMRGLALENLDPAAANGHYRLFLAGDGGSGPYAEAVRARLTAAAPPRRRRPQ